MMAWPEVGTLTWSVDNIKRISVKGMLNDASN